jgi:hypothetical protein
MATMPMEATTAAKSDDQAFATAPALVATLHDPQGACLPFLDCDAVIAALALYPLVTVAVTLDSDRQLTARLTALGAQIVLGGRTGEGRRAALAAAFPHANAYLNCDFDRWLHWAVHWPEELAALPARVSKLGKSEQSGPWCVCLGRTARAFRTHPLTQRVPEAATNRALSLAAGRRLDAVSGATWLSLEGAQLVIAESCEPSAATDLEWAALILRRDPARLRGLRCEGLEWETPDFHAAEIATAGGRDAWTRAVFDTPAMWAARLRLAADSTAALQRVMAGS